MATLRCNPVPRLSKPRYPSKLVTEAIPALLQQHIPPSWNLRPEIISAAALFLGMGVTGCNDSATPQTLSSSSTAITEPVVAPIFRHGSGEGPLRTYDFGPFGGSGPDDTCYTCLTEDEARKVIIEELQKYGIEPDHQDIPLGDVEVPVFKSITRKNWASNRIRPHEQEYTIPFAVDLVDQDSNVYIAVLTSSDRYSFPKPDKPDIITWDAYFSEDGIKSFHYSDFSDIGQELCRVVEDNCTKSVFFSVLYSPEAIWDCSETKRKMFTSPEGETRDERHKRIEKLIQTSENRVKEEQVYPLIRKQVQDLAEWLKAQGAI